MADAHSLLSEPLNVHVVQETIRLRLNAMGVRTGPANSGQAMFSTCSRDHLPRTSGGHTRVSDVLICSLNLTFTSHRTYKPTTSCGCARKHSERYLQSALSWDFAVWARKKRIAGVKWKPT